MKTITRNVITYERINTYNEDIAENLHKLSYTETDDKGNILLDRTYNIEDDSINTVRRSYDEKDCVIEEIFMDGEEENVYEKRHYKYKGNKIDCCDIAYIYDKITEKYVYSPEGRTLKKEIFYEDGSSYIEREYTWNGDKLIEEKEYSDSSELQSKKEYKYDENGNIIKITVYEPDLGIVNKTTETFSYGKFGIEMQQTFNINDELIVRRTFEYDEQGRRSAAIIESTSSYFKHIYGYNENNYCILDQMLNKDDVILNEKRTTFDENGNEIRMDVYSKNIVDNTEELILIESYTTEYQNI